MIPSDLVSGEKPELWTDETWTVLAALASRYMGGNAKPLINLNKTICPNYANPIGDGHEEFTRALHALSIYVIEIGWNPNRTSARWVRLKENAGEHLIELVSTFHPELMPVDPVDGRVLDLNVVRAAIDSYGWMGLRTAAHIAFGDSHALDHAVLPDIPGLWKQVDVRVDGSSMVRVAGIFEMHSDCSSYTTVWKRPGHCIWEWEIPDADPASMIVGQVLYLIENPYPIWELMSRFKGQDVTFICLHGETLRSHNLQEDKALHALLAKIYARHPFLTTRIWADPDPAGLVIANNAFLLVDQLGGKPDFYMMGKEVLGSLSKLVVADEKLKPLTYKDEQMLRNANLRQELHSLRDEMFRLGRKGEQEGLVLVT